MKLRCSALVLCAGLALLAAACGGGGPSAEAPLDAIAFGALDGGQFGLYLVLPDGNALRKLTDETGAVSFPRWSPDGGRIAYVVLPEDTPAPGALRLYDFATHDAATVSERALPGETGPTVSWSPDGERLTFVESVDGGRIRVYDVKDGELLDQPNVPGSSVDWPPPGGELAAVSTGATGETDLFAVDAQGGDLRPLLERPGLEGGPRWSPDGRLLAFWSAPAEQPDERRLLVLDPEDGALTDLGPGFGAAWSPDGLLLAYSDAAEEGGNADLDIYLVPAAGDPRTALNRAITVDRAPSWSPDGDAVAYLAQADRTTAFICVVRLEPEDRDCLDLGSLLPGEPGWSPR